jgi:virulence-associated protein VapD
MACLIVCQWLSNCYRDIQLFRFDDYTGEVYILATGEIEIIVPSDGGWYFL